jgi:hypothetical protein
MQTTATRRTALVAIFNSIDTDNTGSLSKKEVIRALALQTELQQQLAGVPRLGSKMTVSKLRLCIKEMDGAIDAPIEIDEWLDYIEDLADTSILVFTFDAVEPSGSTEGMASIDRLVEEYRVQLVPTVPPTDLIDVLEQHASDRLISKNDWIEVAFQHMNDVQLTEEELTDMKTAAVELQDIDGGKPLPVTPRVMQSVVHKIVDNAVSSAVQGAAKRNVDSGNKEKKQGKAKEENDDDDSDDDDDDLSKLKTNIAHKNKQMEEAKNNRVQKPMALGTQLPDSLQQAAKAIKMSLYALDAMSPQLPTDIVSVASRLLKESGSATEREIILDGIIRRLSTKELIKQANEASQMRKMVDQAIQQTKSSTSGDAPTLALDAIAQMLAVSPSTVSTGPMSPVATTAFASPPTPPTDPNTLSLRSSPVSSAKRRGLEMICLMVEPCTETVAHQYGLGDTNRLVLHLAAMFKEWHFLDGLETIQQYMTSNSSSATTNLCLNQLIRRRSAPKKETPQDEKTQRQENYLVSALVQTITSLTNNVERGRVATGRKKTKNGHRVGFHTHQFLLTNFPSVGPATVSGLQQLVQRLRPVFSNISWRVVYIRAPHPSKTTLFLLSRNFSKKNKTSKATLIEKEQKIIREQKTYQKYVYPLCEYALSLPPFKRLNRNLYDVQINSSITERVKNKRQSKEYVSVAAIQYLDLDQDGSSSQDVHSLALRVCHCVTTGQDLICPIVNPPPVSAPWINKTGTMSTGVQTDENTLHLTPPPLLVFDDIQKKSYKNPKNHQIIKQKKKYQRGQWQSSTENIRGGSEHLRKMLEVQLLQSQEVSRTPRLHQPLSLPSSPFSDTRKNRNPLPSPLHKRIVTTRKHRPRPPPLPPPLTLEMELFGWLKGLGLSYWHRINDATKWRRNLSNGYIIGEILTKYYQPLRYKRSRNKSQRSMTLPLHMLDPCATHKNKKIDNWRIIERFLKEIKLNVNSVETEVRNGTIVRTKRESPFPKRTHGIQDYQNFNLQQVSGAGAGEGGEGRRHGVSSEPLVTHEDIIDGTMHGAPGHAVSMLESIWWHMQHCHKSAKHPKMQFENLYPTPAVPVKERMDPSTVDTFNYHCLEYCSNVLATGMNKLIGKIKASTHGTHQIDLRGFQGGGDMTSLEFNHVMKTQLKVSFDQRNGWQNKQNVNDSNSGGASLLPFGCELDLIIYFFDQNYDGLISFDEVYQKLVRWEDRLEALTMNDHTCIAKKYMLINEQHWERLGGGVDYGQQQQQQQQQHVETNENEKFTNLEEEQQYSTLQQYSTQQQYSMRQQYSTQQQPQHYSQQQEQQYQPQENHDQQQNFVAPLTSNSTPMATATMVTPTITPPTTLPNGEPNGTNGAWVVPAPPMEPVDNEYAILSDVYVPSWQVEDEEDFKPDDEQISWLEASNAAAMSSSMHKYEKWPQY